LAISQAALEQQRHPDARVNVGGTVRPPASAGENEFTIGTVSAPLPQRIDHHWGEGNVPLASLGFRRSHGAPRVGPLANVDLASIQVDIRPAKAAQLAKPHTGENGSDDERPPLGGGIVDECIEFGLGGKVDASPQGAGGVLSIIRL